MNGGKGMSVSKLVFNRIIIFIMIILSMSCTGCKKNPTSSEKSLNLYIDIKDTHSLNIINLIIDEYKKDNISSKVNVKNALGGKMILEDINKGSEADIIFTTRNTMIELSQKGLISEMAPYYDKNKISDRFYKILGQYGKIGDKYYGIGLIPYSVEIVYNNEALSNLKLQPPKNLTEFKDVLLKLKQNSIRVPVLLTEDLDTNAALASLFINSKVKSKVLESSYDSDENSLLKISDIQIVLNEINALVKGGVVDKNSFEMGKEVTINNINKGNIPIMVCISYYNNNLASSGLGLIDDFSFDMSAKSNVPVIINCLMVIPTNGKNSDEVANFIKYALSDETQKKLSNKGFITGNSKANESISGLGKTMAKHIWSSNEDSIMFTYNMPLVLSNELTSKISNILMGKYTGKEWQEIVEASKSEK
jgi:raffinose/stachyose/melibiose transport system substrate-binding protein